MYAQLAATMIMRRKISFQLNILGAVCDSPTAKCRGVVSCKESAEHVCVNINTVYIQLLNIHIYEKLIGVRIFAGCDPP